MGRVERHGLDVGVSHIPRGVFAWTGGPFDGDRIYMPYHGPVDAALSGGLCGRAGAHECGIYSPLALLFSPALAEEPSVLGLTSVFPPFPAHVTLRPTLSNHF